MSLSQMVRVIRNSSLVEWIILLAAGGIILTSPYGGRVVSSALKEYLQQRVRDKEQEKMLESRNISRVLYRLKKRKLIKIRGRDGKTVIELTEQGRKRKLAYELESIAVPKPETWDKKWRLLMFDIPEKEKDTRESFRKKLKNMDFLQFQKSVWIHPYPCEDEIDFVAEYLRAARFITLLTVQIDNDQPLREKFNLR